MQEQTSGFFQICIVSNFKWVICWQLYHNVGYVHVLPLSFLTLEKISIGQYHVIPCPSLDPITAHQITLTG